MGSTRSRLTSPSVGFIPTSDARDDGPMIEPIVSVPTLMAARLAEIATAEPVLDPTGSIDSP
jgi:hypothetical protein